MPPNSQGQTRGHPSKLVILGRSEIPHKAKSWQSVSVSGCDAQMTAHWFLLSVQPRREQFALTGLQARHFNAVLPMTNGDLRNGSGQPTPLWPGYLPVQLTYGVDDFHKVRKTPGVSHIVRFGDSMAKFPAGAIELLMNSDPVDPINYQPGDEVRVTSGIFHDLRGAVEHLASQNRVDVLLEGLGGLTLVRFQMSALEPV